MPSAPIRALLTLAYLLCASESAAQSPLASRPTSLPSSAPTASANGRKLLIIAHGDASSEVAMEAIIDALAVARRYRPQRLEALLPLMRRKDAARDINGALTRGSQWARQAMLALDWPAAAKRLDEALKICAGSFLSLYDPRRVANVHVMRGTVALQRAQPEKARLHFKAALHLAPQLKLNAYHSPQVRAAVTETRRALPARPLPSAALLQRILELTNEAPRALVLSSEPKAGGRVLLKATLFSRHTAELQPLETITTPLEKAKLEKRANRFGAALRRQLEALYPKLPLVVSTQPTTRPGSQPFVPPPPPPPWYKRWYTWVAVGAVVAGAAVGVTYLTRQRVVDINVTW